MGEKHDRPQDQEQRRHDGNRIQGNSGNNLLDGWGGEDLLKGRAGADVVVFSDHGGSDDLLIHEFSKANLDKADFIF